MKVIMEITHENKSVEEAIAINMEAMEWAIKNCPAPYLNAMVDNKFIVLGVMNAYKKSHNPCKDHAPIRSK